MWPHRDVGILSLKSNAATAMFIVVEFYRKERSKQKKKQNKKKKIERCSPLTRISLVIPKSPATDSISISGILNFYAFAIPRIITYLSQIWQTGRQARIISSSSSSSIPFSPCPPYVPKEEPPSPLCFSYEGPFLSGCEDRRGGPNEWDPNYDYYRERPRETERDLSCFVFFCFDLIWCFLWK